DQIQGFRPLPITHASLVLRGLRSVKHRYSIDRKSLCPVVFPDRQLSSNLRVYTYNS
ncbi:hypothetical protein HAX54_027303, partial [Datura stramonium]|nr:hypothetical protein [Datura stramonium]